MPPFSDDDVLDYMVMEAIAIKVAEEEKERAKKQERESFRGSHKGLKAADLMNPLERG